MYLLDTDHLSVLLRGTGPAYRTLRGRTREQPLGEIWYPVVGVHEQLINVHDFFRRVGRDANSLVIAYASLYRLLVATPSRRVAPFDRYCAATCDRLRDEGSKHPEMPLRIAATALANGMTLLTANPGMYAEVPRLTTDN